MSWAVPILLGATVVIGTRLVVAGDPVPVPRASPVPWPLPDQPGKRIAAADLPPHREAAPARHFHVHLDVFVDGARVPVPANLGLHPPYSAVHTHSDSGMVHFETTERDAPVTLGQLFTVWGVRLTPTCIGAYCGPEKAPRLYVNGVEVGGHPARLGLAPFQQIAIVVGAPPPSIPARYDCHNATAVERASCQGFLSGSP